MKRKLFLTSILVLLSVFAIFSTSQAIQYEKIFRGNVLHQGAVELTMPASGSNSGYWVKTDGQIKATFDTKTDTAKFMYLDFNYSDDTGGETVYGLYLNLDDNSTSASTVHMISLQAEADANSTCTALYIDGDFDVGINCLSPFSMGGGLTLEQSAAGDALSITTYSGDSQAIVIDSTTNRSTATAGIIDLNFDANTTNFHGIYVSGTAKDDDAGDVVYGVRVDMTIENDTTATDTVYGQRISITNADATGAGTGLYVNVPNASTQPVTAGIHVENNKSTDVDLTDAIKVTATTDGSIPDAFDASDAEITNALNIGANIIVGTTGVIDFTDFDVDADGKVTLAPDSAGDAISITGFAGDFQALVVDASGYSTNANGIVDIEYDTNVTGSAVNIDTVATDDDAADTIHGVAQTVTVQADSTADDTVYGLSVDITQNDTDSPLGYGLYVSANDSGAGEIAAGVLIDNLQATDIDLKDGVLVRATTADSLVDAFDASDSEITNALNAGDNVILGTTASINFTDFDVSADGQVTLAPDTAGDALNIALGAAGDIQAIVIDAATYKYNGYSGIIDIDYDTNVNAAAGIDILNNCTVDGGADTIAAIRIDQRVANDTGANDSARAMFINSRNNDSGATTYGLYIVADDSATQAMTAGVVIHNDQSTDIDVTDGILFVVDTAGSMPDAIDASDADIDNAINIGANAIAGTNFAVDGSGNITNDSIPQVAFSVGAEAADTITVTVTVEDYGSTTIAKNFAATLWLSDSQGGAPTATAPDGGGVAADGWVTSDGTEMNEITAEIYYVVLTGTDGDASIAIKDDDADNDWYLCGEVDGVVYYSAVIDHAL